MTYTAEQYRATIENYANLDWGPGSHGDRVLAALRIVALVAKPGVIEGVLEDINVANFGMYPELSRVKSAAIRKAVGAE